MFIQQRVVANVSQLHKLVISNLDGACLLTGRISREKKVVPQHHSVNFERHLAPDDVINLCWGRSSRMTPRLIGAKYKL